MDLSTAHGRKELGRRIQSAIVAAGYDSLPAFAERLGCSRALIYQYVNGEVLAQLDRLQLIGELTGRSLEWFLAEDQEVASVSGAELRRLQDQLATARERVEELEAMLLAERGARLRGEERARASQLELIGEVVGAWRRAGQADRLQDAALRMLELARSAGDEPAMLRAELSAGHATWEIGQLDRAREHLGRALELAERLGDSRARLSVAQELVRVHQALGQPDRAREHAEQVAASDQWWSRWSGLLSLAALDEQTGDLDRAEQRLAAVGEIIAEPDAPAEHVPTALTYLQSNRVNVALARGRYQQALAESEELRDLAGRALLPDQLREAALDLGIAYMRLGDLAAAGAQLARLDEWAQMAGDRRAAALARVFEGERLTRAGELPAAKRTCLQALESAMETGPGHVIAEAELALAGVYLAEGALDDAEHQFRRCADRAGRLALRRLSVAARLGLAAVAGARGDQSAREMLSAVAQEAAEVGYEDLRERAESLTGPDTAAG